MSAKSGSTQPIAMKIKELRRAAGFSQQQLGEKVGVHHTSISQFESGKSQPSVKTLQSLAEALGTDLNDLLAGTSASHTDVKADLALAAVGRHSNLLPIRGEGRILSAKLVPANAQAGFAESFLDDTSTLELDVYPHIEFFATADLKDPWAFEVRGESMEPTFRRGSIVICTSIDDGNVQHASGGLFVLVYVIDGYADLVVKRIKTNELSSGGTVTLYSDNPDGGNLTLRRSDIRAMWKVRRAVTEFN